jgi:2'-hydroxyisoflavone reductase
VSDRRQLLKRLAIVSGGLAGASVFRQIAAATRPRKPLRLLVLGGTGAMGPYLVRAAVRRGHRVSVFSRGQRKVDLPPSVERLTGDRNGDLESIRSRNWDAVTDIATFGPGWVRSLGKALQGRIAHYTFISTVSVYDNPGANEVTTEDSPVLTYKGKDDPYAVIDHVGPEYGALKVMCEREAEEQFPGATLVLRPGYVGGPGDQRALTYWAVRASKGGKMMAGGDQTAPVQYIDVRDLADWATRLIEERATGTYNAVGPASPLNVGQLVQTARDTFSPLSSVTWVPASWLLSRKDPYSWGTLLFWSQGIADIMRMSNERALKSGLTTRPLRSTMRDARTWHERQAPEDRLTLVTGFRRKEDGTFSPATSSWFDYLEREKQALADWRANMKGSP